MKLNRGASIALALAVPAVGIVAYVGAMSHASGGVQADEKSARCGVPLAEAEELQRTGPVGAIHAHLCGFHFYNGNMSRQVRADHYCSHLNADVWQCVIYDSDKRNARLIGVEYIVSGKLFKSLPPDEKKLWHSHRYEVMSGQLIASGISDTAENQLMRDFVTTYGKTWYMWQVDRGDPLPLGLPKLMMGFTADGQADPRMVSARDREFGIDSMQVRAKRADIHTDEIAEGADAWRHGIAFQIDDALLAYPLPSGPSAQGR